MFCTKCGNFYDDNAMVCPYCGCPKPTHYTNGQPINPQMYNPQVTQFNSNVSSAKTLGIISIVLGIIIPIVGWICGGIGLSKSNSLVALNPASEEANNAKKLNTIGLIVTSAVYVIKIIISALVYVFAFDTVYNTLHSFL